MIESLAILACIILALLVVFQFLLIIGAPFGKFAWGGNHAVLPTKLRIGSAVSIVLYVIFAVIILSKAGLVEVIDNIEAVNIAIQVLTAYFFVGILLNGISRSKYEKVVMTPVALILGVICLIIATV